MKIVFFILMFVVLLILVLALSTLQIHIKRAHISNNSQKVKYDFLIFFELLFLDKIKIMKLVITKENIQKLIKRINLKEKIKKMDFKKVRSDFPSKEERIEYEKKLNLKLKEIHFDLELGTKDVIVTSFIIAILSSAIGIVIARLIEYYDEEKYVYKMKPVYENRNVIKLSLNCIIQVKVVHIISIIFTLVKKGKEKKKDEYTSNRRSYDYSYEQY